MNQMSCTDREYWTPYKCPSKFSNLLSQHTSKVSSKNLQIKTQLELNYFLCHLHLRTIPKRKKKSARSQSIFSFTAKRHSKQLHTRYHDSHPLTKLRTYPRRFLHTLSCEIIPVGAYSSHLAPNMRSTIHRNSIHTVHSTPVTGEMQLPSTFSWIFEISLST